MHNLFCDLHNIKFPEPADETSMLLGFERWHECIKVSNIKYLSDLLEANTDEHGHNPFLRSIFGSSPFLTQICIKNPTLVFTLLQNGPKHIVESTINKINNYKKKSNWQNNSKIRSMLREAKQNVALAVAAGDLSGEWDLSTTTRCLSDFADSAIDCAANYVLYNAKKKGHIKTHLGHKNLNGSGFIILGMGKLGAHELNYSSDIDLIIFFDPDRIQHSNPEMLQKYCSGMAREIVSILEDRTIDGYVFRTDLRLRPDPGTTPIAISLNAAEIYYESQGQNWERAAMIKARPVAGDLDAGHKFLKWLRPFVWRKNLDFAAIQDIHSIKRQINATQNSNNITVRGHNIKLGRGGIREIEFFAQTQQLIWGGRENSLREKSTVRALEALSHSAKIEVENAAELIDSYTFLRRTEHRLQMINDEQTQIIPGTEREVRKLSIFMNYSNIELFSNNLLNHLDTVTKNYALLFEDEPTLSAAGAFDGNLVFTGSEADPDTLRTIQKFGFLNPETIDSAIRGWHHGRCRAMRSTRAREVLTELTPALLGSLGQSQEPDATFLRFDKFLSSLPAGVQLFTLLYSNPELLSLLVEIMGAAPRLAEELSRRPSLFDSVLSSDFLSPPPSATSLKKNLSKQLLDSEYYEQTLNIVRHWINERKFLIGLQSMRRVISPTEAAWALSDSAEVALNCLLPKIEKEFQMKYGEISKARVCLIALGKLGSHEMTPISDLDLVIIYDYEAGSSDSNGIKSLPPGQYFSRFAQHFISAVMSPTAEGIMYEVDMRLRPSGESGPIACTLKTFSNYHKYEAWVWEKMALTRARVIAGDKSLCKEVNDTILTLLTEKSPSKMLAREIGEIRVKIDKEHHTVSPWSLKYLRGGLMDIEFIIQYLLLKHAPSNPRILSPNTWRALKNIELYELMSQNDIDTLEGALTLWQALQSRLHLSLDKNFPTTDPKHLPKNLQAILAEIGGVNSLDDIEVLIQDTAMKVLIIYERTIGIN